MTTLRLTIGFVVFLHGRSLSSAVFGKPPATPKEEKKASTNQAKISTPDEPGQASILRWLLLQNGGPDAASVGWPELVRVTTGKQVVAFDPANPADAAILAKFGAALDQVLPRLNRPDGPLRAAAPLTSAEVSARVADELRRTLAAPNATAVADLSGTPLSEGIYPAFRLVDAASGKTVYFSVAVYPSGGREGAVSALAYRSGEGARRITTDGGCLLVAVEHNGKAASEMAFLNWELIDLAKVSLRCAVGFEADAAALHQPGAVLTDGRKGRD